MKTSKGFVQFPILISVIFGAIVLAGIGYFGYSEISPRSFPSTTEVEPNQETTSASTTQTSQIDELKKEIEALKMQNVKSEVAVSPSQNHAAITGATTVTPPPILKESPAQTSPTITSFTILPSTATYDDTVTFTWTASNVVSCAVPVINPSELSVPFAGHIPNGSLDYKVQTVGLSQNLTYWIVCADKDWKIVQSKVTLQYIEPYIIGTPVTSSYPDKHINLTFRGAPAAYISCVNANYASPNPPKVVDGIVTADSSHSVSIKMEQDLLAGATLACTVNFGSFNSSSSFVPNGTTASFRVTTPS